MSSNPIFSDLIASKGYVIADGAMGTQLFEAGLDSGNPPESWNVDHPEKIRNVHRAYLHAGADLILTNSFGGNHFRLKLHSLQDQVYELNRAAAHNAKLAADEETGRSGRTVLVAGSMGPTGELLSPLGEMTVSKCEEAYAEQAEALTDGGADLLWIETMSDLAEAEAAVRGVRRASDLPVTVTMSFDTAGRTMMGLSAHMMSRRLETLDLAAIGANCGGLLADTEAAVVDIASNSKDSMADGTNPLVISKPNAGIPEWKADAMAYNGNPQIMAASAHRMLTAGATILGACCGSTPEHIAKMSAVLSGAEPVPDTPSPASSKTTTLKLRKRRRRQR